MGAALSLPRDLTAVSPAAQAVTALMEGWEDADRDAVDLALVEALTNILRHGGQEETRPIDLLVTLAEDRITIDILDGQPPIPPHILACTDTSALEADTADPEGIPEGGRGLALILVLMDEVSLHEVDGRACLRLVLRR